MSLNVGLDAASTMTEVGAHLQEKERRRTGLLVGCCQVHAAKLRLTMI